jgi:hypothetical protein
LEGSEGFERTLKGLWKACEGFERLVKALKGLEKGL